MLSPPKAKDTFFRFYYYFNKYQIYFFLYKDLFIPIINQIDSLILNHEIFYFSLILAINAISISNVYIKRRLRKS